MEACYEHAGEPAENTEAAPDRWETLRDQFETLRESVGSEWVAFGEAVTGPGRDPVRKWLGWALYRVATRVNPEIADSDV